MWVTRCVQLVALSYGLRIASCTLFGRDKLCHKLVNVYLFHKLTTWYWSTNRYASFEMEKNNFLNSKTENRDTELKTLTEWISGMVETGEGRDMYKTVGSWHLFGDLEHNSKITKLLKKVTILACVMMVYYRLAKNTAILLVNCRHIWHANTGINV